ARYDFSKANVVVSLDSDFLNAGHGSLRYARQFAQRRRIGEGAETMNRLYVVEPFPTATGSKADHRMALPATQVEDFAWSLAPALGMGQSAKPSGNATIDKWTAAIARDLQNNKGASLVIAGECQTPAVHALAAAMNDKLGNAGQTVVYTESVEANPVDQL